MATTTTTKQINYYELDKLDAKVFTSLLDETVSTVQNAVNETDNKFSLDELAVKLFDDEKVTKLLLLLARLPVFAKDFEELFQHNLDALQILKKLKFWINLKIRETVYLMVKLSIVAVDPSASNTVDITKYFSVDRQSSDVERLVDLKFNGAVRQGLLFSNDEVKRAYFIKEFDTLEKIEPHAVYPTSIYRQSDGCTVATNDSQKIEAVMSTTLTTSIRISSHVLGYDNNLLAEIYRPLGRVVIVLDDKLNDPSYTSGEVEIATNRRVMANASGECDRITIAEQINRYFSYHDVDVRMLVRSGNEVDKDIENVQELLIELKKLGHSRDEPVLVVGGGVIADIAGFACALFHRNTPYVMLATSIVAGIDAGPSPRTCCDGQGYKNAFGAFHPPVFTLTDKTLWKTMHPGMIRHGIAEIVKMAVVENRELFELLEKVGPKFLVKSKFGTDLEGIDTADVDLEQLDYDCERVIGMAMESYVRAEYGNLWETHQCRPHAYGHTWSPGYELPAGMLHGHAVATCMGFGAFLSWKHCEWISEADFKRICTLINQLELSLWHDVMDDKQIFHSSTKKMIQKRGGNLVAPLPRGEIGQCGYLNDITDEQLSRYVEEYKLLVTSKLGFERNGYGVEPHLEDVGLAEMSAEATAHVRAEDLHEKHAKSTPYCMEVDENPSMSYNEWIKTVQTDRNANWKMNVTFEQPQDTEAPPSFGHNTLFHNKAEEYAMKNTSVSSKNIQAAAEVTMEEEMFAPCMVGTLESQFLKMFAKSSKANNILDVGTFTGMSAIAFAEGALSGGAESPVVHTLEFDAPTAKAADKIFGMCENKVQKAINLHYTSAAKWMEDCANDPNGMTFDIIFLDADKDNYLTYYKIAMGDGVARPLLAKDGVILADNSLCALVYDEDDDRRLALHQFNQAVKNDPRVEQVVMTVREGITMISRV